MEVDALRSVRNAFYLGLYGDVAKEVSALDKNNKDVQGQTHTATTHVNIKERTNKSDV